jgi:starch synthase
VVPSLFEPCGLTQLYGLKYGTLPLVRRVGGLADSVIDCSRQHLDNGTATGIVFDDFSVASFTAAVERAFALFGRRQNWQAVQLRAMQENFSWDTAAARMLQAYRQIAT